MLYKPTVYNVVIPMSRLEGQKHHFSTTTPASDPQLFLLSWLRSVRSLAREVVPETEHETKKEPMRQSLKS